MASIEMSIPEIPREGPRQLRELFLAFDLAGVAVAAVKVSVQQPLHKVRYLHLERLEPSPGRRRRRIALGR